jgi:hypothetical protein
MLRGPGTRDEFREAPDREVGKSGEDRCQVVAYGDSEPSAAFHDRENRRDLWPRLGATDVYPVLSTQSHGTHRILREVIAQFQFWIFQESCELPPKCESVVAGFAERTGGQCNRLRCLDLAANIIEKRFGGFLTPCMARRSSQRFAASVSINGKQFVNARHNRSRNRVSGI